MRVRTTVHVRSEDGAKTAVLEPGDRVPDWAEVTNGLALLDEPAVTEPAPTPVLRVEVPAAPIEAPAELTPTPVKTVRRRPAAKTAEAKAE
ncbi:hypothetical protein [Amycolatopsis sp. PS_44_ISF1]|uniref:hypothetical protein n=1 Tax=Amycolatopsis sp. PS_44_ISF1 TaxID=2974917 RepID=UPI0028DFB849|nr:hypothetical protein [Amycolatopsis sp. PS_44_ISF1]MDT8915754.1 hypothetical protein [Amycolatopsis sp. PS_44_ISF1]